MAQDNFKGLVVGSILALAFVFTVFSFLISTSNDYGKNVNELTEGYYDLSAINQTLSNTEAESRRLADIASEGGQGGGPFSLVEGFFDGVGAFFSVAFSMFGFVFNLFDLLIVQTMNIIFANPILTGVVVTILIVLLLFAVFRFLKQGD